MEQITSIRHVPQVIIQRPLTGIVPSNKSDTLPLPTLSDSTSVFVSVSKLPTAGTSKSMTSTETTGGVSDSSVSVPPANNDNASSRSLGSDVEPGWDGDDGTDSMISMILGMEFWTDVGVGVGGTGEDCVMC